MCLELKHVSSGYLFLPMHFPSAFDFLQKLNAIAKSVYRLYTERRSASETDIEFVLYHLISLSPLINPPNA